MAAGLPSPRRQRLRRGTISIVAAWGLLAIGIPTLGLAVDLGRIAWQRRQLQTVADLAAMNAARRVGPCIADPGGYVLAAQQIAARNGYEGTLGVGANVVELGFISVVGGLREFTAGGNETSAEAVRVVVTQDVPLSLFASLLLPGDTGLRAEAVASVTARGGIQAGSFAASADPGSADLLNELFGDLFDASFNVLSYEDIFDAHISVNDLIEADPSVGSFEELLELELSAAGFLELMVDALNGSGQGDAAAALEDAANSAAPGATISMEDVLGMSPDAVGDALSGGINAFDLLSIGAQIANGDTGFDIPINFVIPNVSSMSARGRILEAPQSAYGLPGLGPGGSWRTQARTSQMRIELSLALSTNELVGLPVSVEVSLFVEAAQTVASLLTIDCASAGAPEHELEVQAEPGLVSLGLGEFPDFDDPNSTPQETTIVTFGPLGPGTPLAEINGFASADFQSSGETLSFVGPFVPDLEEPSDENSEQIGSETGDMLTSALSSAVGNTTFDVHVVGLPLGVSDATLIGELSSVLAPVVADLDEPLTALFQALGLQVGGARITVYRVDANRPALVR